MSQQLLRAHQRIAKLKDQRRNDKLKLMEKQRELDQLKMSVKKHRPTHGRNGVKASTLSPMELGNNDIIGKYYQGHVFHHFPFLPRSELNQYTPNDPNTVCGSLDKLLDHPPGLTRDGLESFWFDSTVDLLNKKKIEKHSNVNHQVQAAFRCKCKVHVVFCFYYPLSNH